MRCVVGKSTDHIKLTIKFKPQNIQCHVAVIPALLLGDRKGQHEKCPEVCIPTAETRYPTSTSGKHMPSKVL